tara:strand:- start:150 stop:566 length:417 start_codon:yes stop_codon:yes gene_type:complete
MITFIVKKDDVTKTIQFSNEGTLLDLKKEIINQYDLKCKYIDIVSTNDRPIRSMGKFNFDIGVQPRTLDNYKFDRYNLDDKTISITYEINDEYNPIIKKASVHSGVKSKYVPVSGQRMNPIEEQPYFDIGSETDFPTL